MTFRIVVGLDGSGADGQAVRFARELSQSVGECELLLVYVIEWSPFTFQTPEENAERHKRREEEIATAKERVVDPAVAALSSDGIAAQGLVRHGNVADTLDAVARECGARQIVVGRSDAKSLSTRIFGSSTANLVMHSSVPVTVVS